MNYTNDQLLKILFDHIIHSYRQTELANFWLQYEEIIKRNRKEVFPFMVELFDLSKFPQVVSDEEFDKIKSENLYRGVRDSEHVANTLCDFNYHYGTGINDGLYASNDKKIAFAYTSKKIPEKTEERVLKFKLDPTTKICRIQDINAASTHMLIAYLDTSLQYDVLVNRSSEKFKDYPNCAQIRQRIEDFVCYASKIKEKRDLNIIYNTFYYEESNLAVYLGFDAMQVTPDNIVIFNREKIMVPQSEFDRFVSKSKGYNSDGTIKRLSGDESSESNSDKVLQKC